MKALNCPNCGGAYNPAKYRCEYCGSFVIFSDEKAFNVPLEVVNDMRGAFENCESNKSDYPGVYIFGSLIGKGEVPVRLGAANYYKNALINVGGKCLLTERNFYFSSHTFVQSKTDVSIELNQIERCEYDGSNLGISDQISIYANGKRHKFVVYRGKEWINMIEKTRQGRNSRTFNGVQNVKQSSITNSNNYTEELVALKKLLDAGIITEEEFTIKKRMLLGL